MNLARLLSLLIRLRLELVAKVLYGRWLERRITFGLVENERLLWQIVEGR